MSTKDEGAEPGSSARGGRTSPLWRKAPVVLLRFPALLASLATGALLLALAASSYPLFISATASAALEKQIDYTTRFGSGVAVQSQAAVIDIPGEPGVLETFRRRDDLVRDTLRSPHLGPPIATILGQIVNVRSAEQPDRTNGVRLMSREGFLDHIEIVDGEHGPGVWIAELVARRLGVKAGDRIEIYNTEGEDSVSMPVNGRYKDLFNQPRRPYWLPLYQNIYAPNPDAGPPPTFLFMTEEQVLTLSKRFAPDEIQPGGFPTERLIQRWDAPLQTSEPITLEDAREVQAFADRFDKLFRTDERFSEVFCFSCFRGIPFVSSNIREVVLQTDRRLAPVEGPVRLVLVAGLLVALAVIAGAGVFAVATRRTETGLLFARGMNPLTVAVKTSLESFVPALLGAAVGYGLALLLVSVGGPGGPVAEEARRNAFLFAAIAVPVSIVLLGLVASVSFARYSESASERLSMVARFPWEIALLLAAGYFYNRLRAGGALVEDEAIGVTRPSISLLVFPILLIGGFGMLGARGFQSGIAWLRDKMKRASSAIFLMLHRVAGARRLAMLLFAGAALSLGIFVHAQTIVNSLERTVDAKAYLFVGSDVQATVRPDAELPDVPFPVTKSTRLLDAGEVLPAGRSVDLLAVDVQTIADATYWDPQFGASSIDAIVDEIADDGGDTLKVAVANAPLGRADSFLYGGDETYPIEVVATVDTFPGTSSRAPLIVADSKALARIIPVLGPLENSRASTELWGKGDPQTVANHFSALEDRPYTILSAEEVKDIPSISAVIDTFGVLNVLGLGAGLLVVVVILMYLQARQRARIVSFALSRRMGLSVGSHRWALVAELGVLLLGSFVLGGILAIGAAIIIVGMIDPLAAIPPEPLFIPPLGRFAIAVVALVGIATAGGALTNRRARRARVAEVMRVAE